MAINHKICPPPYFLAISGHFPVNVFVSSDTLQVHFRSKTVENGLEQKHAGIVPSNQFPKYSSDVWARGCEGNFYMHL